MGDAAGQLLVFNAGSSSLKLALFDGSDGLRARLRGAVTGIGRSRCTLAIGAASEEVGRVADAAGAAEIVLNRITDAGRGTGLIRGDIGATGHRVVHGGEYFSSTVRVDAPVIERLQSLEALAPLHNPPALAVLKTVAAHFPGVPAFAAFDTAFFRDLPEAVRAYAIPAPWAERYAIRRYGFHGIAHLCMAQYAAECLSPRAAPARIISLHLGQGCSMAALCNGRPVETSMGFTPLEGLIMGTRTGDIDAGVLLHLARQGHTWEELDEALTRRSGLRGLSGASDDVRELLKRERQQHPGATLALAAVGPRINTYLGAYAAVLGGIDAILIGGGIGENSAEIRARICRRLGWLGVEFDEAANAEISTGGRISTVTSGVAVHVVPVDEEAVIATSVRESLNAGRTDSRPNREWS